MTPQDTAFKMEQLIGALTKEGKRSEGLIEEKSMALVAYKKERAKRTVILRADGMPATLIKHTAEGDAAEQEGEMSMTADTLKAHFVRMENLRAQLNGYQSINKFLAVTS